MHAIIQFYAQDQGSQTPVLEGCCFLPDLNEWIVNRLVDSYRPG